MTRVAPGSDSFIFKSKQDIADYITAKILANGKRCIGTEWEMFFVDSAGKAITRADGQKAFVEFKHVFALAGYNADYIFEESSQERKIVGLTVDGLGLITPEAGHQFEFACSLCTDSKEVMEKNEAAYKVLCEVAQRLDYRPVFRGHVPGYVESTEGMNHSRGAQWRNYYETRFGEDAVLLREMQDGTASVQVTIDSGGEKFHEFYKALLLIEPALSLHYSNSQRSYFGMQSYGYLIPSQVTPVTTVWNAKDPQEAVAAIVDRLMDIEVPFLPDPEKSNLYKAEALIENRAPTTQILMEQGRLSEKNLNNIGGFFYTRPALKNFANGLIEVRGIDSQPTPEDVAEIAQRVTNILYNDRVREKLLEDYATLNAADILAFHQASTLPDKSDAMKIKIADIKVQDLVGNILMRSEPVSFDRKTALSLKESA